jgi:hypothetical protein
MTTLLVQVYVMISEMILVSNRFVATTVANAMKMEGLDETVMQ